MAAKYTVTADEINRITDLGYAWIHTPPPPAQELINQHFDGFQPYLFLKQIEQLLRGLTASPVNRLFQLTVTPPSLAIYFYSDDYNDMNSGLLFARTFTHYPAGTIVVSHDYFRLPASARGQKTGKNVLGVCFEQYQQIGISKIMVHAALQDGGYVWARAGFKATIQKEMEIILEVAERQLPTDEYNIAKSWYEDHYNNFPGTPFNISDWSGLPFMEPILRGSDWHGEIDLTNPAELRNFKKYVSR
jgi:hypothetical protein